MLIDAVAKASFSDDSKLLIGEMSKEVVMADAFVQILHDNMTNASNNFFTSIYILPAISKLEGFAR